MTSLPSLRGAEGDAAIQSTPLDCFAGARNDDLAFLEQLFGGGAVGLSPLRMRFDTGDLRLERLDAGLQLLDRHGVEVLLRKLDQGIAGLAWK